MKYNVHVYRTVSMKVRDIEAKGPLEAIKKADTFTELHAIRHEIDLIDGAEVMDDDGTTYYLADPLDKNGEVDDTHSNWYGPAPFYSKDATSLSDVLLKVFNDPGNCAKIKGMHPYLDLLILENKLSWNKPLDEDEFRRLPTLLNKDEGLDEKIKERLTKGR
jgi:hypothetical protein